MERDVIAAKPIIRRPREMLLRQTTALMRSAFHPDAFNLPDLDTIIRRILHASASHWNGVDPALWQFVKIA